MPTRRSRLRRVCFACFFLLGFSISVGAHEGHRDRNGRGSTVEEHLKTDFGFKGFRELNKQLHEDFLSFDNRENLAIAANTHQSPFSLNGHLTGAWSPTFSLPLVPIHVMLLTNGKLLMWDSVGDLPAEDYPEHNQTRAAIWDPNTNFVTTVNNTSGYNIFCAGFAHLPDGTPFLAGGNRSRFLDGTNTTHFFDQSTNSWSLGPFMSNYRWYPTVTPLANGEMLITSGYPDTHEVYSTSGTLRTLSTATWWMPLYPWLQAAPNGKAFYFGPNDVMRYLDPNGTGAWSSNWSRDGIWREYGSYAMYDIGKIVASGGDSSSRTTVHIDIRNPNIPPVVTNPSNMIHRRRQHNLTILPDGSVLATGGNSSGADLLDINNNVYEAELWNPVTQTWRALSSADKIRQYHSTAILLPDARVFTGGGGICGDCFDNNYLEKNLEIYTPPYLFDQDGSGNLAARPSIAAAPTTVTYDQSFSIATPDAETISQVVMMRVSSVTHSIDFEQRRVPLVFNIAGDSAIGTGLTVKAPPNSNIAPPGYYMLFLIDSSGVPSVAEMVRVEYGSDLGAPLIVESYGGQSQVTLSWIPVLGATGYTIKYGTSSGNYTDTVQVGSVTTATIMNLPVSQYYFVVSASGNSVVGGNSNEVVVSNVGPTSAAVELSGRVLGPNGVGIPNARVRLQGQDGEYQRNAITNSFGYYAFRDLESGGAYIVSVESKRHSFQEPTRFVTANENLSNIDFVSDPW